MKKAGPKLLGNPYAKGIPSFLEQKTSLGKLEHSPLALQPCAVVVINLLIKSKPSRLHKDTGKCKGITPTHCQLGKLRYERKKASAQLMH